MKKKLLHIIVTLCTIFAGVLFLRASSQSFAQTQHTISGTVYVDVNRNGVKDANDIVPDSTRIKITHNKKEALVPIQPNGKYSYQTADSGIFEVSFLFPRHFSGTDRYTKSIYLSNSISKATVNFFVAENSPPISSLSIQSLTVQSTADCDFSRPVTCGEVYFCEDANTQSRWCAYTDTEEWCVDFIDYCASGQTCTNGQCGGGSQPPPTTCGTSINAACCNGTCVDGLNLVCTSIAAGGNANSCQQCGDQGEFCCSNSRCNGNLTCTNYVCQQNVTYSVSGYVFIDRNRNQVVDGNDVPYTASPITLSINPSVGSVSTNGGYYSKVLPTNGSYSIGIPTQNLPSNYELISQNSVAFTVNDSQPSRTIDFAIAPREQYSVTGYVFIDTNKNGVKDTNEVGSGNETVSIVSSDGTVNAQSNSTGLYNRILTNPGNYSISLVTRPQFDNTSPEIVTFSVTDNAPIKTVNFGIVPKATPIPPGPPIVKFLKPATDNLTVSGIIEVQATASVSGSTFTSFKICSDQPGDCLTADPASITNRSTITVNVPGGVNTTGLSNGNHTLTATAIAANGKTGEGKRTIKVQNNTPTPTKSPTQTPTKSPTTTPIPNSSGTPATTHTGTPLPSDSITPSASPTPGACNNNNLCEFGENINSCPGDCEIRCGDNICSEPTENQFSCAADCGDPGTSVTPSPTGTGVTNTPSPTRNPSHTATPTLPVGSSNTPSPTRNPSHTATPTMAVGQTGTPAPTLSPAPQDIVLNVSVKLPGIGNKSGDNANPVNKTITAAVAIYNNSNQYVKQATGNLTFDGQVFKGSVNMGSLPAGSYSAYIKTNNSLIKRLTITITGGTGASLTVPQVELVTGDFDQTNKLDIVDYNKILGCYGKNRSSGCTLQDLNDDGKIDEKDVNIFLRGFSIREGDKI